MKIKQKIIMFIVAFCLAATASIPFTSVEAKAEVKGSTKYLINQMSKYEGKKLSSVKSVMKSQGYTLYKGSHKNNWCAWYLSNCAKCAYVGNYTGSKSISKSAIVRSLANNFAKFNGTKKRSARSYKPKAGDIVIEGGYAHIGIMVSSKKAAFGNEGGRLHYSKSTVKIRKPYNVTYYIPRPNWYYVYYSDGLSKTSASKDMKVNPPKKVTFGKSVKTSKKKFTRAGYQYSYYYIYRQDYNQKKKKYTNYYYSKNTKTGKYKWVKSGTKGYVKYKKKVGAKIKFSYDANFAAARIILTPVWEKKKEKTQTSL